MKELTRDYLYYFNYVDHPTEADPDTTFVCYDKEVQHDMIKLEQNFNGYKRCNANAISRVSGKDKLELTEAN